MKTIKIISGFILAISLAGFVGCEGPAGSQGEQGPQGEQGQAGPQGTQGEEGTANVIYSGWMEIEWNGYNAEGSAYKRMDIIEPRITGEFMRRGTTLMYLQISGAVFALPFTTASGNATYSFFLRPEGYSAPVPGTFPEEPGLSFYLQSEVLIAYFGGLPRIRYVLIPGGLPAKISSDFWNDYEAAAEYFGIPE